MNKKTFSRIFPKFLFGLICVLASSPIVLAQDKSPVSNAPQSDAKKAFEQMKTLLGSWKGTIMNIPINITIRVASSGTAIIHEANTTSEGPPKQEITMFYLEGDKLLATHYCDGANRARLEGKLSPDGKTVEFSFLDVSGSTKGGLVKRMAFISIDANKHAAEFTFIMPNGKPIELRGEFQKNASTTALQSGNKRLYDGGTAMLLLSAVKMPEEHYGFKPTDADPSFGQMLAEVANWQYRNCSVVLGEKNYRPKLEGAVTSKTDLIAALKEAFAYCGKAYETINDESAAQLVTFSSPAGPALIPNQQLLNINMGLNSLHYGNLMIYLRLKSIVPPSSDPEIQKQAEKLLKK